MRRIADRESIFQFAKFVLSGVFNTFAGFAIFWFLLDVVGLFYQLASLLTWLVSLAINFALLRVWVFKHQTGRPDVSTYMRYFATHIGYFGLNLGLLISLVELFGANPLLAQLALLPCLVPVLFLATRYFVFRQGSRTAVAPGG